MTDAHLLLILIGSFLVALGARGIWRTSEEALWSPQTFETEPRWVLRDPVQFSWSLPLVLFWAFYFAKGPVTPASLARRGVKIQNAAMWRVLHDTYKDHSWLLLGMGTILFIALAACS